MAKDTKKLAYNEALNYIQAIDADISNFYKKIRNVTILVFFIILSFIAMSIFPLFYPSLLTNLFQKMMYASIGILTFISIFYSLIISPEGKKILGVVEKYNKSIEEQIKEIAIEEIKQSESSKELQKAIKKVNRKLFWVSTVKETIDIGYSLIMTVTFLILSIFLSLFNHVTLFFAAYVFFLMGVSLTLSIVITWRVLYLMVEKNGLDKKVD